MVREAEGKSEIATILNKYKDTLDDLIDRLDTESLDQSESLDWLEPIDKGIRNVLASKNDSLSLSKKDCLDEDVLIKLLGLVLKIWDSQIYKDYNLHSLVSRVGEHNIKRVKGIKKIGKINRVERMKKITGVEKAIIEIT